MPRSYKHLALMLSGPVLLVAVAAGYYALNANYVRTDNAYIRQDKVSVSAEVGGRIVEVAVRENQLVNAGDLLLRIDPEPYELIVAEARAAVATAKARVEQLETDYETSSVEIESALEDIDYYQKEYDRQVELVKTKVSSQAALQAAEHALSEARSKLANARATAAKARAALSTGGTDSSVNPAVRAAQVQLEKARLDLSRTEVRSPTAGIVSQTDRLQLGQVMMQALPAVTIVRNTASWVQANFKETDLEKMRIGQPATITVDMYPGVELNGHVASFGAGTGSEFSLLPAQNASANWVKVTQRVPVRIAIDDTPASPLIAGLSVEVRVDVSQ